MDKNTANGTTAKETAEWELPDNERYANDPIYRAKRLQKSRERYKTLSQDPEHRKRLAEQQRKRFNDRYANDPEFRERYKAKKREQYHKRKSKKT